MPAPGTGVTRQRYKVVVLGAPSAGKTAIVRRLADGSFVEVARPRGLDFYTCHISLREDVAVTLQLWDLSDCPCRAQDDHAPLDAYIYNSQAVLFVYDVSCPSSLESLRYALSAVEAAAGAAGGAMPYFALVANKADLQWAASEPLARELAARHGCVRFTMSARSGHGVSRAAVQLAADLAGVPLAAATEHSSRFLEPVGSPFLGPGPLQLDPADPSAASTQQQYKSPGLPLWPLAGAAGTAISGADVCAAKLSPGLSDPPMGLAVTALQQWHAALGKFQARAPAYQTMPSQSPLQASASGSVNELGVYGVRGCGGGSSGSICAGQLWQPLSCSTTPSRTAMVTNRAGALGQCIHSGGPPPLPPPSLPLAEAGRTGSAKGEGPAHGSAGTVSDRSTSLSPSGNLRRQGSSCWRVLLCCLPAQRR